MMKESLPSDFQEFVDDGIDIDVFNVVCHSYWCLNI